MKLIVCLLMFFYFTQVNAQSDWRFLRQVDKITDKVKCSVYGPMDGRVAFVLGDDGVVVIPKPTRMISRDASLFVRVDKRPAVEFIVSSGTVGFVRDSELLRSVLSQMAAGQTVVLRLASSYGVSDAEFSLTGFDSALEQHRACQAGI